MIFLSVGLVILPEYPLKNWNVGHQTVRLSCKSDSSVPGLLMCMFRDGQATAIMVLFYGLIKSNAKKIFALTPQNAQKIEPFLKMILITLFQICFNCVL